MTTTQQEAFKKFQEAKGHRFESESLSYYEVWKAARIFTQKDVERVAEAIRKEHAKRNKYCMKSYVNMKTNESYDEADIYAKAALEAVGKVE